MELFIVLIWCSTIGERIPVATKPTGKPAVNATGTTTALTTPPAVWQDDNNAKIPIDKINFFINLLLLNFLNIFSIFYYNKKKIKFKGKIKKTNF